MRRTLPLLLLMLLAGCQALDNISNNDSAAYLPPEPLYTTPKTTSGGLFRAGHRGSLVGDRRAASVGDILTVVLAESTQSSKSAGTSFGKESSLSIGIPTLFNNRYDELQSSASANRDFDGSGSSSQQNTLRGSIAVVVHEVLPGGTLLVKGEKTLQLNQGDEIIQLSGLVRQDDINRYNQVSSQNIANAKIAYAGRGALADSNRPGWLTRFFTSPLFPF